MKCNRSVFENKAQWTHARWMPPRPRLPRKVPRRHGRQAATQARHQSQLSAASATLPQAKATWMSPSATHATQMQRGCHQVPFLPRRVRAAGWQTWTKRANGRMPRKSNVDFTKCHSCHAECAPLVGKRGPSAQTQCHKGHACHAKALWMSPSAMPASATLPTQGKCVLLCESYVRQSCV